MYRALTVKTLHVSVALAVGAWAHALAQQASAATTAFFNTNQVAVPVSSGTTSDTVSSEGYVFTYTRDKLSTGGGSQPIGRPVRVTWPDGIEAQYVTTQSNNASITIRRQDGATFDFVSFTAKLLANAGAGRAIEIVPMLNGEEPLPNPVFFDVSGNYGSEFSYDTTPNHLGSTATLTNYDTYIVKLSLDYALTALALDSNESPTAIELSGATVPENEPVGTWVGTFSTTDPDAGDTFTYTLVAGPGSSDNASFSISGTDLLTAATFDHGIKSSYSIRVRSTDPGGLWIEQPFTITVTAVPLVLDAPQIAPGGGEAVLQWSSLPNRFYTVLQSSNLSTGFSPLQTNLPATPPMNSYTDSVTGVAMKFWKVSAQQ